MSEKISNAYIIMSSPRSGSTYLSNLISLHPEIRDYHETLMLDHSFSYPSNTNIMTSMFKGLNDYNVPFDKIRDIPADLLFRDTFWFDDNITVGCKMFWGLRHHGSQESDRNTTYYWLRNFLYIINNFHYKLKIIYLDRKNVLRQYLSLQSALNFNKWDTLSKPLVKNVKIKFIANDFLNYLNSSYSSLHKPEFIKSLLSGLPEIHIDYSDISSSDKCSETMSKIYDFLEVDNTKIDFSKSRFNKLHKVHATGMVSNPVEMVNFLNSNGFSYLLEDDMDL